MRRTPALLMMTLWAALLIAVPLSGGLHAHQQKAAITQVGFNERSGNLEIMHRFSLHDAEHAVRALFDGSADIIGSEQTRQQFADYIRDTFALYRTDGSELPLRSVGHEIEGTFFWVYQELPVDAPPLELRARHDALRELWPEQTNTVNVQLHGALHTLTFSGATRRLTAWFD